MEASFDAASSDDASKLAKELREKLPVIPAVKSMRIVWDQKRVALSVHMNGEDLFSLVPHGSQTLTNVAEAASGSEPAVDPVTFEITRLEDARPRFIRIYNLDEGTREILLPYLRAAN